MPFGIFHCQYPLNKGFCNWSIIICLNFFVFLFTHNLHIFLYIKIIEIYIIVFTLNNVLNSSTLMLNQYVRNVELQRLFIYVYIYIWDKKLRSPIQSCTLIQWRWTSAIGNCCFDPILNISGCITMRYKYIER